MAHHLAELIEQARTMEGAEQRQAQAVAADLILKLWSKRENLPGEAYPLKGWGRALAMLRLLEVEASPFNRISQRQIDRVLVETFDHLRTIVAHGIVLTLGTQSEPKGEDAATPFLDGEEKRFIEAMSHWFEHFRQARRSRYPNIVITTEANRIAKNVEPEKITEEETSKRVFVAEIDDLITTLSKLRIEIEKI